MKKKLLVGALLAGVIALSSIGSAYAAWIETRTVQTSTMILKAGTFELEGLDCEEAPAGEWVTCEANIANESEATVWILDVVTSSNRPDDFQVNQGTYKLDGVAGNIAAAQTLAVGQRAVLAVEWRVLPGSIPGPIGITVDVTCDGA